MKRVRAEMGWSRETLQGRTVDSCVIGHTDEGHRELKEQEQVWVASRSRTHPVLCRVAEAPLGRACDMG